MEKGKSPSGISTPKPGGVRPKYIVARLDGSSLPGGEHARCQLMVMDLAHDPWADAAIQAIIEHCKGYDPQLAMDLRRWLQQRIWPVRTDQLTIDEASTLINQEKARAKA